MPVGPLNDGRPLKAMLARGIGFAALILVAPVAQVALASDSASAHASAGSRGAEAEAEAGRRAGRAEEEGLTRTRVG